jgi:VanZ family protein
MISKRIKRGLFFWAPVVVWAGVIFAFSSIPATPTSEIHWQDFIVKKSAHFVEYAILATLLFRALTGSGIERKRSGYLSILFSVLYAASDEFHQSFTPGREATVRDVLIDTAGAVSAVYYIQNILPNTKGNLRKLAKLMKII